MPGITSSLLFERATSDYYTGILKSYQKNNQVQTFIQTIWQASDERARGEEFKIGKDWFTQYLSTLQANLNTAIEKLNNAYRALLERSFHETSTTYNTASLTNRLKNAANAPQSDWQYAALNSTLNDVPYSAYIKNGYYNPFFGSRAIEKEPNTTVRANYDVYEMKQEYDFVDAVGGNKEKATRGIGVSNIGMWRDTEEPLTPDGYLTNRWFFVREFKVNDTTGTWSIKANGTDYVKVWINGTEVGEANYSGSQNSNGGVNTTISNYIKYGTNRIVIEAAMPHHTDITGTTYYSTSTQTGRAAVWAQLLKNGTVYNDPSTISQVNTDNYNDFINWIVTDDNSFNKPPQVITRYDKVYSETGSLFTAINYLWKWDVDRINQQYATTMTPSPPYDKIVEASNPDKLGINFTALRPNRVEQNAQVGDRIPITNLLAPIGMKVGNIVYENDGYHLDQSLGTELEAVVTEVKTLPTGQVVPAKYKVVYKGTMIEPMMEVIRDITNIPINISLGAGNHNGYEMFDLSPAQHAITPFPDIYIPFTGNTYGYQTSVNGYNGHSYDANASQGIRNMSNGVWSMTNVGGRHSKYFCVRKKITLPGQPLALGSVGISGYVDDDVNIFVRNANNVTSRVYSDTQSGANNFNGTISFNALTAGDNWIEVYATNGVFSGSTNAWHTTNNDAIRITTSTINIPVISQMDYVPRYEIDENGNIYDRFGVSGWSSPSGYTQTSNPNKIIEGNRDGTGGDDNRLFDYVVPESTRDWIGSIPTKFIYYREELDKHTLDSVGTIVTDANKTGNINFDPMETNILGDYNNTQINNWNTTKGLALNPVNHRVIFNPHYSSIEGTTLTYVEQDPYIYNSKIPTGYVNWEGFLDFMPATFTQVQKATNPFIFNRTNNPRTPKDVPKHPAWYGAPLDTNGWIWGDTTYSDDFTLWRSVHIDDTTGTFIIRGACDDRADIEINGTPVGSFIGHSSLTTIPITLQKGENQIKVRIRDTGGDPAGLNLQMLRNGSIYTDPVSGTQINTNGDRTNWRIEQSGASNTITVTGLSSGMKVIFKDADGNVIDEEIASTTPVNLSLDKPGNPTERIWNGYFEVYDEHNNLLYTSSNIVSIFAGDTFNLSGNSAAGPVRVTGLAPGMRVQLCDEAGNVIDTKTADSMGVELDPGGALSNAYFKIYQIDGSLYTITTRYLVNYGDVYNLSMPGTPYPQNPPQDLVGKSNLLPNNNGDVSLFLSFVNKDREGNPINTRIKKIKVEVDGEPYPNEFRTIRYSTYIWNGSENQFDATTWNSYSGWLGNYPLGIDIPEIQGTSNPQVDPYIDNTGYSPGGVRINSKTVLSTNFESGNFSGWVAKPISGDPGTNVGADEIANSGDEWCLWNVNPDTKKNGAYGLYYGNNPNGVYINSYQPANYPFTYQTGPDAFIGLVADSTNPTGWTTATRYSGQICQWRRLDYHGDSPNDSDSWAWVYNNGANPGDYNEDFGDPDNEGWLYSPEFDLTQGGSFTFWYSTELCSNHGDLFVDVGNDTDGWTNVLNIGRQNIPWTEVTAALPAKLHPSRIRVRHITQDGHGTPDWGSAVDDMKIVATVPAPPRSYNAAEIESPEFSLLDSNGTPYQKATLSFWHRYEVGSSNDQRRIYYYNGSSWQPIGDSIFSSTSKGWTLEKIDLPTNATKIKFVFDTKDGKDNYHFGWAIDDIKVTGETVVNVPPTLPSDLSIYTDSTGTRVLRLFMDRDRALSYGAPMKVTVEYDEFIDSNGNGVMDPGEATATNKVRVFGAMTDSNGRAIDGGTPELDNGRVGFMDSTLSGSYINPYKSRDWIFDDYYNGGTGGTDGAQTGYLVIGKGSSGGSPDNPLTKLLKSYIDDPEFQDIFKYRLFEDIILTASTQDAYGDMVMGKLILNWDWKKRRINVYQGSFFAVYHS